MKRWNSPHQVFKTSDGEPTSQERGKQTTQQINYQPLHNSTMAVRHSAE